MKKIFLIAIILVLALSLTACGNNSNTNNTSSGSSTPSGDYSAPNNPASTNSGDNIVIGEDFEFDMDFINDHMPESYWIKYNVTIHHDGETESVTMEQIRTPEGYYFAQDEDDGMLFIKKGDSYDAYYGYDGEFESAGMTYSKDMVDAMMFGINGYMTTHAAFSSQLGKSIGNQTVAGRNCAKYSFSAAGIAGGYKMNYTYYIDKETGVCLKVDMEIQGEGQKVGYEFEATKFETSSAKLPDYN